MHTSTNCITHLLYTVGNLHINTVDQDMLLTTCVMVHLLSTNVML